MLVVMLEFVVEYEIVGVIEFVMFLNINDVGEIEREFVCFVVIMILGW